VLLSLQASSAELVAHEQPLWQEQPKWAVRAGRLVNKSALPVRRGAAVRAHDSPSPHAQCHSPRAWNGMPTAGLCPRTSRPASSRRHGDCAALRRC